MFDLKHHQECADVNVLSCFPKRDARAILKGVHLDFGHILKSEIKMPNVGWLDFLLLSRGAHGIWERPKYPFKNSLRKKLIYKPLDIALKKESDRQSKTQNLACNVFKIIMF